jgi:hypothetical protein
MHEQGEQILLADKKALSGFIGLRLPNLMTVLALSLRKWPFRSFFNIQIVI